MPTVKNVRGTNTNCVTTELNSLANNTNVIGPTITVTSGEEGHRSGEAELVVTFPVAPIVSTSVVLWILREVDGANFEDGGASVTPTRVPDAIFTVRPVTVAQRIVALVDIPPGTFKCLLRNDGTTQAMAASGNTLKIRPFTESF